MRTYVYANDVCVGDIVRDIEHGSMSVTQIIRGIDHQGATFTFRLVGSDVTTFRTFRAFGSLELLSAI